MNITRSFRNELLKKLDKDQLAFYNSMHTNLITCCDARAGTGKTTVATMAALDMLESDSVTKIIYLRFPDKMVQSLGAFPGELKEKERYYMQPFIDACEELGIQEELLQSQYVDYNKVLMMTNVTLRGSNFSNAAVIIDEAQNASFKDLKLVLTRLHDTCKCALIGHVAQCDNKNSSKEDAFSMYIDHLSKKKWTKVIHLKTNYRGELSNWADSLELTDKGYIIDKT